MGFCARSTGSAPPRRIYWTMCASSWPRPAAAASAKLRSRQRLPRPRTTSAPRAAFARLSSSCTLLDGARNRHEGRAERAIERSEEPMHDTPDQVHWHEPKAGENAGYGKFKRAPMPYDRFMEAEGVPVYRGIGVRRVQDLPLAPWKRLGGRGSYIQLFGTEGLWGLYLVEIPSAGALNVERHLYEKVVLVVEGRGTTEVWQEGQGKRHVFEWQKGSLFSIPLNAYHRLVNAASAPALLLCGTSAPNVMNVIDNTDFVFNCPYTFSERFAGAEDYFKPRDDIEPDPIRGLAMRRTNLIPDIVNT